MTLFIGDVHGKFDRYKHIIRDHINTIQVGDMGVGFFNPATDDPLPNPPYRKMLEGGHRFIRGNHDNPTVCKSHSRWIQDGHIESGVMFIGGATSIDKEYRVIGRTWWPDEELTYAELSALVDVYKSARPRVMVTHECPGWVAGEMGYRLFKLQDQSATRHAFNVMSEAHQPEIWIFGHWHVSFDKILNGTRYVCLNELEAKEIEVKL